MLLRQTKKKICKILRSSLAPTSYTPKIPQKKPVGMVSKRRSLSFCLSAMISVVSCVHGGSSKPVSSARFAPERCPTPLPRQKPTLGPLVDVTPQGESYEFFEGPVWIDREQAFLVSAWNFSDPTSGFGPPTTILSLKNQEAVPITEKGSVRTNGLALDHLGDLVGAVHGNRSVVSLKNLTPSPKASHFQNRPFHSPNDLVVRSDGTIYFTDPDYQRDQRTPYPPSTGVYGISPTNQEVFLVDEARVQPNGITLSPDERYLYVGGGDGKIYRYDLSPQGFSLNKNLFSNPETTIDGMSVDCQGNVYAALHTKQEIVVYSPKGEEIIRYPVGHNTTNLAFGGPEGKTLLITTAGRIFKVESSIPGSAY